MKEPPGSILVVGAGVFGLAGALELRARGWEVTVLDSGPVPHPDASSTDISKIVRMDYGADGELTRLAARAIEAWEAWNVEAEPPLYHPDGFLLLAGGPLERGGYEADSLRLVSAEGCPVDRLGGDALGARFPAWNGARFPDGYLTRRAGGAESGAVVTRRSARARAAGVEIREGARVAAIDREDGGVRGVLLADGRELRSDRVLVAAGAWTPSLVPDLDGPLRPTGQPVLHFAVDDPEPWSPPRFVPWAADIARTGWYGFPARRTGDGWVVKVGHHGPGLPGRPGDDAGVPEAHIERCRSFLADALPGLAERPVAARRVCWYCDAFDGYFWIDRHPELRGLSVASGGSGHGFKFAPVLGPLVADAVEGKENPELAPFRWREGGPERREDARYRG